MDDSARAQQVLIGEQKTDNPCYYNIIVDGNVWQKCPCDAIPEIFIMIVFMYLYILPVL